jgi:hypothetical protein
MSQINDSVKIIGDVSVTLRDETGAIKEQREFKNLVVSAGKSFIASRILGTSVAVLSHIGIGSGSVAPTTADTALGAQLARVALTSATQSSNVATYNAFFAAGVGTGSVTEAGLFNASTAGTMVSRVTFASIGKAAGDTLDVSWTLTVN